MIGPGCVGRCSLQRRTLANNGRRGELVVAQDALPIRALAQDQDHVCEVGLDPAVLVENELVGPIRSSLLSAPKLCLSRLFQFVETVAQNELETTFLETTEMLPAAATRRMKCITDFRNNAIRVEGDAAQLLDRLRGAHGLVQPQLLEHCVGPSEELSVALGLRLRVRVGNWRRRRNR